MATRKAPALNFKMTTWSLVNVAYYTKPGTDTFEEIVKELESRDDFPEVVDNYHVELLRQADDFYKGLVHRR
jgi:hypothetical protein